MQEYKETQKFNQWWIWIIFGIVIYTAFNSIAILFIIPLMILFYYSRLETKIDNQGIRVGFFPFRFTKHIKWEEIDQCYVRKYSPILEYGGWGWRFAFANGTAFNVSGNMGLQLILHSGKKILIGTNKAKELEVFITSIHKLNKK